MKTLSTEIILPAPPAKVWAVLMDFERYPEWNPFVTEILGRAELGAELDVRLSPPKGRPMTVHPTLVVLEPERHFAWLGHLMITGLFDGEHHFELEPAAGEATRLRHYENFTGLLVPALLRLVGDKTRAGFEAMNIALREHLAEA